MPRPRTLKTIPPGSPIPRMAAQPPPMAATIGGGYIY